MIVMVAAETGEEQLTQKHKLKHSPETERLLEARRAEDDPDKRKDI